VNLRQEAAYCERSSAILGCLHGRVGVVLEGRRKSGKREGGREGKKEGGREGKKGRREEGKGEDMHFVRFSHTVDYGECPTC